MDQVLRLCVTKKPNKALQQTGHANNVNARHSGFSRVSRLLSLVFGLGGVDDRQGELMPEKEQAEVLEEVRAMVRHAFAGVRTPATDHITRCPCSECRGVRDDLATDLRADWAEVPAEKIIANHDKLSLLTPEAFHYYLPAFMSYALAHWHSSVVWEFTIYALTPEERHGEHDDWWHERFEPFTPPQVQAIYAFLDLLLLDTEDWFMWTCADRGKRQLAKYTAQE